MLKSISFFSASALIVFILMGVFAPAGLYSVNGTCGACSSDVERIEFVNLPYFEQADWYESWDPWYGTHGTSVIEFSDGYKGKIFKGGMSGKYFIGDKSGGKYYYISQEATARALYLYKRYGCISKKYRH